MNVTAVLIAFFIMLLGSQGFIYLSGRAKAEDQLYRECLAVARETKASVINCRR